jgi:predicted nucleotidyltransferase
MRKRSEIKNKSLLRILDDVKQMALEMFGDSLKEIILYGSYARENQTGESDVDILFLFDEDKHEIIKYRDRIADIMVDLSLKYDLVVSITENTVEDFKSYIRYIPFYSNVYREGVEVYAG